MVTPKEKAPGSVRSSGARTKKTQPKYSPTVAVTSLLLLDEVQQRAELDERLVSEYAETLDAQGWVFPPAVVYLSQDADGLDVRILAEGFHRVAAVGRCAAKIAEIPATIRLGGIREAILHACGANADHGLRRTNADKRKAVTTLLRDREWGNATDNWIAETCKVSPTTVGTIRRETAQAPVPLSNLDSGEPTQEGVLTVQLDSGEPTHEGVPLSNLDSGDAVHLSETTSGEPMPDPTDMRESASGAPAKEPEKTTLADVRSARKRPAPAPASVMRKAKDGRTINVANIGKTAKTSPSKVNPAVLAVHHTILVTAALANLSRVDADLIESDAKRLCGELVDALVRYLPRLSLDGRNELCRRIWAAGLSGVEVAGNA